MSTSSGVGSQDGGEPNECNTKDGEKVNKIDFDRIVQSYIIWGYSYMYLVAR